MQNITYKSYCYLFILLPTKVCNFHMSVFQIKLKYHSSKPIKLQKLLKTCSSIIKEITSEEARLGQTSVSGATTSYAATTYPKHPKFPPSQSCIKDCSGKDFTFLLHGSSFYVIVYFVFPKAYAKRRTFHKTNQSVIWVDLN